MVLYFAVLALILIASFSTTIVPWLAKHISKELAALLVALAYIVGLWLLGMLFSLPIAGLVGLIILLVHFSRFSALKEKNIISFIAGVDSSGMQTQAQYSASLAEKIFSM